MLDPMPALPELGAPTVDAHAHLAMLDDPGGALVRAARAGVELIASVVDLTESPSDTFEGLSGWLAEAEARSGQEGLEAPEVKLVVGWHPHNAKLGDESLFERLRSAAHDPRVAALGELGLDYHYEHSPRQDQRRWFQKHLELAHEVGLPVEIHLRDAHEEGLALLQEAGVPPAGCIIHCFTEGPDMAERFLELGCYISFAGPVTFKKAAEVREAAAVVPLDRLLVETDCPFLAPHPYRGRPNEPAFVTLNAAAVAEAKSTAPAEVASAALANAQRLFSRACVR